VALPNFSLQTLNAFSGDELYMYYRYVWIFLGDLVFAPTSGDLLHSLLAFPPLRVWNADAFLFVHF
jgi:hypothetical protein